MRAFDRGLAEASVAERPRRDRAGRLRRRTRHERAVSRFAPPPRAVRSHLTAALPAAVLAARPFTAPPGAARSARCSASWPTQRRGLGVRGLLATYGELITAIMPCVLVSPDSVARFFPATAGLSTWWSSTRRRRSGSPTPSARWAGRRRPSSSGTPSRCRRRLRGSSRRRRRGRRAAPTARRADEESILTECVQAGLPRQWLSWHYRSQDEALIAFSNAQLLRGPAVVLPGPLPGRASAEPTAAGLAGAGRRHVPARRAAATLRTNPVEAAAVVAEILRRFAALAPAARRRSAWSPSTPSSGR